MQDERGIRVADEVEDASSGAKLSKALFDNLGFEAPRLDVLAGMHAETDVKRACKLSGSPELFAMLLDPVVWESRVRGEGYETLLHTEELDPVPGVPPHDGL